MYKSLPIVYKISFILLTICIVLGLFTFFIHKWIIFPAFSEIEYQAAEKNGGRVVNAIDREIHFIESLCKDWAYWDDTYEYAKTRGSEYIESNINPNTYDTNELNMLYILGKDGQVLWGRCYDLADKTYIRIKEIPEAQFDQSHPMAIDLSSDKPLADQGGSGIIKIGDGFMLFSSQPILTSDNTGPSRGTLIMGKIMNAAWIERLCKQIRLDIEMVDLTVAIPEKSQGLDAAIKRLSEKMSFYIHELKNSVLNIYSPLFDVQKNKVLMLKVTVKGKILERGKKTLAFALNASAVAVVAILLLMFLVISKTIVSPISTLSDHIHSISQTGDLSSRLTINNRYDEIGSLGEQYNKMLDQLEKKTDQLNQMATTDPLTGMFNRRHAMEFFDQGLSAARRYSQDLSIILLDIDFFKKVNDTYGHNVGDDVLVTVSQTIKLNLRSSDIAARIGGEEFLVILPNQNLEKAKIVGEKLRILVSELIWDQPGLEVTISAGICDDTSLDPSGMLAAADKKLYSAKNQGRNRIL